MNYEVFWNEVRDKGNIALLRPPVIIYDNVKFGPGFVCSHFTVIRENTVIGKNVNIGPFNDIEGDITIGDGCKIQPCVHLTRRSKIGKNVFISPGTVTLNTMHPLCKNDTKSCSKGVTIGNNVKIGGNVTINPGVRIGKNSIVGAGAVVTKDMPAYSVIMGVPAKVVGKVSEMRCKIDPTKRCY